LLEEERAALVRLDREAIEAFAARKLELDGELGRSTAQEPLGASERQILERVRQAALRNQLLLAHARSCVQGVLSLLSPANAPAYAAPAYAAPRPHGSTDVAPVRPMALNLRR
jgi:hypothetical protein